MIFLLVSWRPHSSSHAWLLGACWRVSCLGWGAVVEESSRRLSQLKDMLGEPSLPHSAFRLGFTLLWVASGASCILSPRCHIPLVSLVWMLS